MKKAILLLFVFSVCTQSGKAQFRRLSLDMSLEQNFMLDDWSSNKRYDKPLTDRSTDLSFRLNWGAANFFGFWGQLSMVFASGSRVEPAEEYLDMFHKDFDLNLDNYYMKDMKFHSRINYVPTLRVAVGSYMRIRYKKCKFMPYIGAGFEGINTTQLSYDLKQKDSNAVYEVDYSWGGKNPNTYLGFISTEMKFAYMFYPKRDLIIGLTYRRYVTKPEFRRTIKDYYREKKDDTLMKVIEKGNLLNSLGVSVGINFR